ncbi:MAG: GrpB family protein, partial [Chloroflexota bacterium]
AIGEWAVAIEHVGSTAVPGLAAKPIIDIMPAIRSLADARHIIAPMEALGYEYVPEFEDDLPERRYFRRGVPRSHHVHVVETTSTFWRRHLAFRDYLRAHPETAAEYAALKRRLADGYGSDSGGYTNAKTEFITRIERLALEGRPA